MICMLILHYPICTLSLSSDCGRMRMCFYMCENGRIKKFTILFAQSSSSSIFPYIRQSLNDHLYYLNAAINLKRETLVPMVFFILLFLESSKKNVITYSFIGQTKSHTYTAVFLSLSLSSKFPNLFFCACLPSTRERKMLVE